MGSTGTIWCTVWSTAAWKPPLPLSFRYSAGTALTSISCIAPHWPQQLATAVPVARIGWRGEPAGSASQHRSHPVDNGWSQAAQSGQLCVVQDRSVWAHIGPSLRQHQGQQCGPSGHCASNFRENAERINPSPATANSTATVPSIHLRSRAYAFIAPFVEKISA